MFLKTLVAPLNVLEDSALWLFLKFHFFFKFLVLLLLLVLFSVVIHECLGDRLAHKLGSISIPTFESSVTARGFSSMGPPGSASSLQSTKKWALSSDVSMTMAASSVSDFVCHRCPGYHDSRSELLCHNVLRCACVYLCPRSSGVSYPRSTSLHMDGLFL